MSKNPDALIRIEDAIKVLCRKTCHPGALCPDGYCVEMWDEFEDVERVDAVPVKHGRWIKSSRDYDCIVCSECGTRCGTEPFGYGHYLSDFCPSCGADMRKDGDHAEGTIQKEQS